MLKKIPTQTDVGIDGGRDAPGQGVELGAGTDLKRAGVLTCRHIDLDGFHQGDGVAIHIVVVPVIVSAACPATEKKRWLRS